MGTDRASPGHKACPGAPRCPGGDQARWESTCRPKAYSRRTSAHRAPAPAPRGGTHRGRPTRPPATALRNAGAVPAIPPPPCRRPRPGSAPRRRTPPARRSSPCGTAGCRGRRARTARSACGPSAAAAAAPRRSRTPPWRPQDTGYPLPTAPLPNPRRPAHAAPPAPMGRGTARPPAGSPLPGPVAALRPRPPRRHCAGVGAGGSHRQLRAAPPPPHTLAPAWPRPPPAATANRGRGARPAGGPRPNRRSAPARLQLWNVGGGSRGASRRGETPARPTEGRGRRERRARQPTRQRQDCSCRAPPRPPPPPRRRLCEGRRSWGGCGGPGLGRERSGAYCPPGERPAAGPPGRRAPAGPPPVPAASSPAVWLGQRRQAEAGSRCPREDEAGLCFSHRPGRPPPSPRCRRWVQVRRDGVGLGVIGLSLFWVSRSWFDRAEHCRPVC